MPAPAKHDVGPTPIERLAATYAGSTPVDRLAIKMMRVWGEVDPRSKVAQHPASYVTNFVDMARAALEHVGRDADVDAVAGALTHAGWAFDQDHAAAMASVAIEALSGERTGPAEPACVTGGAADDDTYTPLGPVTVHLTPEHVEIAESAAIDVLEDDESDGMVAFDLGVKIARAVLSVAAQPAEHAGASAQPDTLAGQVTALARRLRRTGHEDLATELTALVWIHYRTEAAAHRGPHQDGER